MAKLVQRYNHYCEKEGCDPHYGLNKSVYKKALERTLALSAIEDMTEHGRLLTLKEQLISLVDASEDISVKTLGMFQIKDFCAIDLELERALTGGSESTAKDISDAMDELDDEILDEVIENVDFTPKQAGKAIKARQEQMVFPEGKAIPLGASNVVDMLPTISEAIQKKDGLVGPDETQFFRGAMKILITSD